MYIRYYYSLVQCWGEICETVWQALRKDSGQIGRQMALCQAGRRKEDLKDDYWTRGEHDDGWCTNGGAKKNTFAGSSVCSTALQSVAVIWFLPQSESVLLLNQVRVKSNSKRNSTLRGSVSVRPHTPNHPNINCFSSGRMFWAQLFSPQPLIKQHYCFCHAQLFLIFIDN